MADDLNVAIEGLSTSPMSSPTSMDRKLRRNSAPDRLDEGASLSPKSNAGDGVAAGDDIRHDPHYEAFYQNYKGEESLPLPVSCKQPPRTATPP